MQVKVGDRVVLPEFGGQKLIMEDNKVKLYSSTFGTPKGTVARYRKWVLSVFVCFEGFEGI